MAKRSLFVSVSLVLSAIIIGGALWLQTRSTIPQLPQQTDSAVTKPANLEPPAATYVDREECAACHAEQEALWRGSHHDLAMQPATEDTVLGNFDNAEFTYAGITSHFYRDTERFMVRTDGPDGELQDYEIAYTFGVEPLQQYLIEFPGGRLQTLGIAWDTRPAGEGGQRWFHLYPDENVDHKDELHWTGRNQNWNYMCAECHSTNLKKNYDAASRRFDTSWSEIDVSCEACHGPGSRHLDWANQDASYRAANTDPGLTVRFDERKNVAWPIDPKTGNAKRSRSRETSTEIELCARCHARRGLLSGDYVPGQAFLDTHRPALLAEGLYHPDGQIQDEVYVYGSFIQSRMFHAGVTCSDCHEPHSLALRAPGEQVCLSCHAAEKFATSTHHFHQADGAGASCLDCHMPARTYMVVDPRRDHSIRVPRPDLSVRLGVPNACTQCHTDQSDAWAAAKLGDWYAGPVTGYQDYAEALHAGREGMPEAARLLIELVGREDQPAIARATAASLLARYPLPRGLQAVSDALHDPDALVRLGGLAALEGYSQDLQFKLAQHLLDDPVHAVRIEAGRMLAVVPQRALEPAQRNRLKKAIDAYIAAQQVNADRPQAQVNLGNLYTRLGRAGEAEAAYREALLLDKTFVPGYINLADLYRQAGREAEALNTLEQGMALAPDAASLHHALGLALVRGKQLGPAVEALGRAHDLADDNARYAYTYAVALDAAGEFDAAIDLLEEAHALHQHDAEILSALIAYTRKAGDTEKADRYAAQFDELQSRSRDALR